MFAFDLLLFMVVNPFFVLIRRMLLYCWVSILYCSSLFLLSNMKGLMFSSKN